MSGMEIQTTHPQPSQVRTPLQTSQELEQRSQEAGLPKPLQAKSLADLRHPLDRMLNGAQDFEKVRAELQSRPELREANEVTINAAAAVLCHNVSPALIMQQLESIYREQAMASKKMASELSVEVAQIRTDVRQDQLEASKEQLDAGLKKATIALGTGLAGSALSLGGGVLGGRAGSMGKFASGLGSTGEVLSRQGEGIGEMATIAQNKAAALKKTNADFMKSVGDEFSKKTDQMEQNAQELRRRAAESIQTAVSLNAQAQQSVNLKL